MRAAARIDGLGTTIFTEMTALAERTGAINLGQGFPDKDGPAAVIEAAVAALRGGDNQYAPLPGVPALREAVLEHQRALLRARTRGRAGHVRRDRGDRGRAARAVRARRRGGRARALLRLLRGVHRASPARSGGRSRCARPTSRSTPTRCDAAIGAARARAAAQLARTIRPGASSPRDELEPIAAACIEHDLICVSDEVYEHLVFDGEHIPIATLPGMAERTLTISSVGKSFSFTGWKIGWCSGPGGARRARVRTVKQFLTFAGGTPLQHAAAAALRLPAGDLDGAARRPRGPSAITCARDSLPPACSRCAPPGTYFVNADVGDDAVEFCAQLPERCGVVAIPTSVFYDDRGGARRSCASPSASAPR